jgi:hypothetical protein
MEFLDVNWALMLELCYSWEDLTREEQVYFLYEMEPGVIPAESLDSVFAESFVASEFMMLSPTGKSLSVTSIARQFHRIVNALAQHRENEENYIHVPLGDLIDYLRTFYSRPERERLTLLIRGMMWAESDLAIQVGAAAWPGRFLGCSSMAEWETGFPPSEPDNPDLKRMEAVFAYAKKLLRKLMSEDWWLPVAFLPHLAPDEEEDLLLDALKLLLENMLVFVEFSGFDMSLNVGVWAGIYRFLNPADFEPASLKTHDCPAQPSPAFLVSDMTEVLFEAAQTPVRITRSTGKPYRQIQKRILERLVELPEFVIYRDLYTKSERIDRAMLEARLSGLGDVSDQGTGIVFKTTATGKFWLAASPADKLKMILDRHKPSCFELKRDCFNRDVWGEGNSVLFSLDAVRKLNRSHYIQTDLFPSAYHALQSLCGLSKPVTENSFFQYHAEENNPLEVLFHSGAPQLMSDEILMEYVTEHNDMVRLWTEYLTDFIQQTVVPLGMLATAQVDICEETLTVFRLSDIGRYFTGEISELEATAPAPVVVQPDFGIFFSGPNPSAAVSLSRFTDRTGFSEGCLFKLSASSVYRAVGAGMSSCEMLATLARASAEPVPAAVACQIELWASECSRISAETLVVITCPDRETALRVARIAGKKAKLISDTVLTVTNRKVLKKLEQLLALKGVFLE